jgi:hypothetical protein
MLYDKNILNNMKTFTCCHCLKKIQKPPILLLQYCKNHLCDECIYFLLSTSETHTQYIQVFSQNKSVKV